MKLLICLLGLSVSNAHGFVKAITVNLDDLPTVNRWAALPKAEQKKVKLKDPLARAGLFETLGDFTNCVKEVRKVSSKSIVRDYALLLELGCAKMAVDNDVKNTGPQQAGTFLREALAKVDSYSLWAVDRISKKNQQVAEARLSYLQWLKRRSKWKELRSELRKTFKEEPLFEAPDRSQIYFLSGELLVAERQWVDALWQFDRARNINPDTLVDARVKGILPMVPQSVRTQITSVSPPQESPVPALQPSGEEQDLINQAQSYLTRNELLDAVEAMERLIKKFPMGVKSKWAQDKIFELLSAEVQKSRGPEGSSVAKRKIENAMLEFDSERQFDWGRALFSSQAYNEAGPLLKRSAEQLGSSAKAVRNYYMAARAYQLSGKYSEAKQIYSVVLKNYPLAPETLDAAIQWAIVNYNEGDFSEAITHLEVARARKMSNQQDLVSLFWLYQSYKQKKAEAEMNRAGEQLIERFPLTYYGLIAYQDLKRSLPSFEKQKLKTGKVYFSDNESFSLERAKALLNSGLIDEASQELSYVTSRPLSQDESLYLSYFYAQALNYNKSFGLVSAFLEQMPDKRSEATLKHFFPQEYSNLLKEDKKRSNLDPLLVLSVMRQESSFSFSAVSRSGAVGLMQMLPPTADEVKKEVGLQAEIPKDLEDPAINIRLCTHYLDKLIKRFNGSIPLALAAYNAGPTRLSQFMSVYNSGGAVLRDTWVDELPWAETSFYVKSILKNYLVYRILYSGLSQMPTPPWINGQTPSAKK